MLVNLLHGVVDSVIGVPGVSKKLYLLLGHGRWHDLLHAVVAASSEGVSVAPLGLGSLAEGQGDGGAS